MFINMSFRKRAIKNVPKIQLHSYTTLVVGGYKSGKTRLWKEVTEKHYDNPDDTLLLAFEDGYESWEIENIIPLHAEGTDKDLWKVWDFFKKKVVPGLVQEAKEGRVTKLIGTDTVDRAIDACSAWVLHDRSRRYGRNFISPQDISENTDENGWIAIGDELKRPFDTLKNAGYGLFHIGWTRERETTLYDGRKYNSIQLAMANTGKKVFESQASLICCLHDDVSIFDREGQELDDNIKDKRGRDRATNFHETKTMMYFRPSGYVEIAGGRFTDLPDKVEYSADSFLEVFENAVKGQLKKTDKSIEKLEEQEDEARQEKTEETVERIEEKENNPENLLEEIKSVVDQMNLEQKNKAAEGFEKAFKVKNYMQEKDNPENLKIALKIVQDVME